MIRISTQNAKIEKVITHLVGNKKREEKLSLSENLTDVNDESLEYILKYFLSQFETFEIYHFNIDGPNRVYSYALDIFSDSDFKESSNEIATFLYDSSMHPKIKSGELNVAVFNEILVDDEIVQGIGIFKSESKEPYLSMRKHKPQSYQINHKYGYGLKSLDKGCLILNSHQENGFIVLVLDKVSGDAQYWMKDFLQVSPSGNDFQATNGFLDMTRKFFKNDEEVNEKLEKTDKIDRLNQTMNFFKEKNTFDMDDFENEILRDHEVIESFRNFVPEYKSNNNNVSLENSFDISNQAVKRQAKFFRSVLKLDKNFHIYIHGDRSMIEKGVDTDGRKFYKVYFDNES